MNNLEIVLNEALSNPLQDERKVLETIVGAITAKCTDPDLIRQAVRQTVTNYENQLRVFMIALANQQLSRILRLTRSLDEIEERFQNKELLDNMNSKDLVRLYAVQQSNLVHSLDYVKRVADMRIELAAAQAAVSTSLLDDKEEVEKLSGLPKLTAQQRNNVRKIIEGLVKDVSEE